MAKLKHYRHKKVRKSKTHRKQCLSKSKGGKFYMSNSIKKLKRVLKAAGLKSTGKKANLCSRARAHRLIKKV